MSPRRRELDLREAASALAQGNAGDVTMATVARRLGVAKPTLYRLARSRAELIQACLDAEAERLLDHVYAAYGRGAGESAESRFAAAQAAVFRFREDSPGGFALLFGGRFPEARPVLRRVEDRVRDLLRRDARAGGRDLDHPDLAAAAVLGSAVAVVRRRLEDGHGAAPGFNPVA